MARSGRERSTCDANERTHLVARLFDETLDRLRDHIVTAGGRFARQSNDCDDVVQATCLIAWQERERFNGRTADELLAWLRPIARHALLHHVRDERRIARRLQELFERERERERETSSACDPRAASFSDEVVGGRNDGARESHLDDADVARARAALARLREADRELIVALWVRGERVTDFAARLGVTAGVVRKRLQRARERLRRWFRRLYDAERAT